MNTEIKDLSRRSSLHVASEWDGLIEANREEQTAFDSTNWRSSLTLLPFEPSCHDISKKLAGSCGAKVPIPATSRLYKTWPPAQSRIALFSYQFTSPRSHPLPTYIYILYLAFQTDTTKEVLECGFVDWSMSSIPEVEALTTYKGQCHCAAVQYEMKIPSLEERKAIRCNCSNCVTHGSLMTHMNRN